MRYIPTQLTQADVKRIGLAAKHAQFGLADPTAAFRERGFNTMISDRGIVVRFKGHQIASLRHRLLEVIDQVPQEADRALLSLVHGARDVAKRADAMIRADKRELQAKVDAMKGGPATFPIRPEDLYVLLAVPGADPEIRIKKGWSYDKDFESYTVEARSTLFRATKIIKEGAFTVQGDVARKGTMAIPAETFTAMIAHARTRYDALVSALPVKEASSQVLSQDELRKIYVSSDFRTAESQGVTIKDDYESTFIVTFQDITIMRIKAEENDDGSFSTVLTHGGIPDAKLHGILAMLKAEMEAQKAPPPEIKERLSPDEVGALAGAALAEIDLGYGF